jgi:hypothetical protein
MQATDERAELIAQYATDPKFFWRVYKGCRMDIDSARKKVGSSTLPEREVRADIATSIKLGVIRAWMYRFLREQGVQPAEFFSKQRNRDTDYVNLKVAYPDFEDFRPSTPITSDEVFESTREEIRNVFKGRGSDAHQMRLHKYGPGDFRPGTILIQEPESEGGKDEDVANHIRPSGEYLASVNNRAFQLNRPEDPFGPVILRVAAHFITVFGLIPTTYWVFEKMFYPGEYATLLRAFGADEAKDPAGFKAMQVDLSRKLRVMDEEMATMADNGTLKDYYDSLGEDE